MRRRTKENPCLIMLLDEACMIQLQMFLSLFCSMRKEEESCNVKEGSKEEAVNEDQSQLTFENSVAISATFPNFGLFLSFFRLISFSILIAD